MSSEIINPTITVDFTGTTPAGGSSLGYLTEGFHTGTVLETRQYEDNAGRLYVYMITDGIRHRESFNLSGNGLAFLMGFLVSAGIPEDKMSGSMKLPMDKVVNRPVFFNYTPPELEDNGRRVEGSYPRYRFYQKAQFEQIVSATSKPVSSDFQVEAAAPTNGSNGKAVAAPAASSEENFDFLLEG